MQPSMLHSRTVEDAMCCHGGARTAIIVASLCQHDILHTSRCTCTLLHYSCECQQNSEAACIPKVCASKCENDTCRPEWCYVMQEFEDLYLARHERKPKLVRKLTPSGKVTLNAAQYGGAGASHALPPLAQSLTERCGQAPAATSGTGPPTGIGIARARCLHRDSMHMLWLHACLPRLLLHQSVAVRHHE